MQIYLLRHGIAEDAKPGTTGCRAGPYAAMAATNCAAY